jgi:hypothetical protein
MITALSTPALNTHQRGAATTGFLFVIHHRTQKSGQNIPNTATNVTAATKTNSHNLVRSGSRKRICRSASRPKTKRRLSGWLSKTRMCRIFLLPTVDGRRFTCVMTKIFLAWTADCPLAESDLLSRKAVRGIARFPRNHCFSLVKRVMNCNEKLPSDRRFSRPKPWLVCQFRPPWSLGYLTPNNGVVPEFVIGRAQHRRQSG